MLWRRYRILLPIIAFGLFYLIIQNYYRPKPANPDIVTVNIKKKLIVRKTGRIHIKYVPFSALSAAKPKHIELPEPGARRVLNPSGEYAAYIEPFEWEVCGNIYIKNLKTGMVKKLTDYKESRENKPKLIAWFDDTLMLVIEGYTWGTVSVGGSVYLVHSRTGEYKLAVDHPPKQEIVDVSVKRDSVFLCFIKWTDDNYMESEYYTWRRSKNSVLRSVARRENRNQ